MSEAGDPIIATLGLDAESQACFERLRQRLFPPERNIVPAHLTLFHQLPPDLDAVRSALSPITRQKAPFEIKVGDAFSLGGGVAFRVHNEALDNLRYRLAKPFRDRLTNQDRNSFRGHITVQNKVKKRRAQKTLSVLKSADMPKHVRAEAVELWFYRGGPWEAVGRLELGG